MKKYTYIFGMIIAAFAATACSVEYAIVPTVRVESRVRVRTPRVRRHIPAPLPPVPAPAYHIPGVPGHEPAHNTTIIIANNQKPAPAPKATHNVAPKATSKAAPKVAPKAAPATPAPATRPGNQAKAEVSGTRQARPAAQANRNTSSTPTNTANRGR